MRPHILSFGFALVAALGFIRPANATVFLAAVSGADSTTVSDVSQGTPGQTLITGTFGSYTITAALGFSQPIIPAPLQVLMAADVTANAAGTLLIEVSITDLSLAGLNEYLSQFTGASGVSGGSVELKTFIDASDTPFGQATALSDSGLIPSAAYLDSLLSPPEGPLPGLFSLTELFLVTGGVGETTLTALVASIPVPEPSTAGLLFASALGGLFMLRRKADAR